MQILLLTFDHLRRYAMSTNPIKVKPQFQSTDTFFASPICLIDIHVTIAFRLVSSQHCCRTLTLSDTAVIISVLLPSYAITISHC